MVNVVDIIIDLMRIAEECNPQSPELQKLAECPVDHPECCGRCEIVHKARAMVVKLKARAEIMGTMRL